MSMLPVALKATPLNMPKKHAVLVFVPFELVITQPFRVPRRRLERGGSCGFMYFLSFAEVW
jgi:hypothetical protein